MPKTSGLDGIALAAAAAGALFVWSGFAGKGILAGVQGLIKGVAPADIPTTQPITPVPLPTAATATGSATGAAIANDAAKYEGAGYVFGGAPARGPGEWDCSSFVNKIVGIDFGLAIPGVAAGHYTGTSHGPTALMWSLWDGCTTIGTDPAAALPGDLCCWQTHIGIALGGGEMISARSAKDTPPTGKNKIANDIPGEHLTIRRLKGA